MRITGLIAFVLLLAVAPEAPGQASDFTYQGVLNDGGPPAEGVYDIRYGIYDGPTSSNGTYLSGGEIEDLVISNGLFTVDLLAEHWVFGGATRWLGVEVRTNGPGEYAMLEPWTEITPTPYAVRALTVAGDAFEGGHSGVVSFSNSSNTFTGTFTGDGGTLSNVTATTLEGLTSDDFWQLGGNAGTTAGADFVGTTDDEPLEFKVNNTRALRLEPDPTSPTIIGGYSGNSIGSGAYGAVIAGGGESGRENTIGGSSVHSVIGGGRENAIGSGAWFALLSGGVLNDIGTDAAYTAIGGGFDNNIASNTWDASIGGGSFNDIGVDSAAGRVGGGQYNRIGNNAPWSTIGGGSTNWVRWRYGTIAGGESNYVASGHGSIGGGRGNNVSTPYSTIAGGELNVAGGLGSHNAMGGGLANLIGSHSSYATIAGGSSNSVGSHALWSTIPGGSRNEIGNNGYYALAAGYRAKANHEGSFVWADSTDDDFASTADNQFLVRASGGVGIGTTSPDAPLHIDGGTDTAVGGGGYAVLGDLTAGNISIDDNEIMARKNGATSSLFLNVNGGTVAIGTSSADTTYTLRVNGSVAGVGAYNIISDARYKTDIREVEDALDKVMHMRGVHYDWKTEEFPDLRFDEGRQLGFVAQELAEVVPEVVSRDDEGSLSVAYSKLIPLLVEAVKEQQRMSADALQQRDEEIAELSQRLRDLERLVTTRVTSGAK